MGQRVRVTTDYEMVVLTEVYDPSGSPKCSTEFAPQLREHRSMLLRPPTQAGEQPLC